MVALSDQQLPAHPSAASLAFMLLGGPLAWLAQLYGAYMLASHACYPHVAPEILPMTAWLSPLLALMTILALAVAILAFATAWRWSEGARAAPAAPPPTLGVGAGRDRFLAVVGLIVNGLFAVACLFALTAYQLIPLCG
jgi:hypothetical protein